MEKRNKHLKKKKKSIIVLVSFLFFLLIIALYFVIILVSPLNKTEFAQRINYCHNRGKINITVEGKKVYLDEIKIRRINKSANIDEKAAIDDGSFIFLSGKYGMDVYEIVLEKKDTYLDKNITVKFEKFNENNWNVNVFNIEIDIYEKNSELYANVDSTVSDIPVSTDNKVSKDGNVTIFSMKN